MWVKCPGRPPAPRIWQGGNFILGRSTLEDGSKWLMVMNKDMQSTQTLSLQSARRTRLREWSWETGLLAPVTDCAEADGKRVFQISVEAGDAGLMSGVEGSVTVCFVPKHAGNILCLHYAASRRRAHKRQEAD